jgi:hypothetical protein
LLDEGDEDSLRRRVGFYLSSDEPQLVAVTPMGV